MTVYAPSGTTVPIMASGAKYAAAASSLGGLSVTVGLWVAGVFVVYDSGASFDQMSLNVTTLGATAAPRLGIYAMAGGLPAALLKEVGTIDASTTGEKAVAISSALVLAPGVYALAILGEGATCSVESGQGVPLGMPYSAGSVYNGWFKSGVATGAMPAPAPGALSLTTNALRPSLRRV